MKSFHNIFLFAVIVVVYFTLCIAQVNESWSARYNGTGNGFDQTRAMVVDTAGHIYVTGSVFSGAQTGVDFCTIKYSSSGDTLWVRTYNGTGNSTDFARSIALDKNGNICIVGDSRSGASSGTEDYVTIKYNSSGDSLWSRRYNGTGNKGDIPFAIGVDDSGNVYVTGMSPGPDNALDITTIKYNADGSEQWVERFAGDATFGFSNVAYAMVVTDSGYVHLGGHANNQTTFWDFAAVKYDRTGNRLWRSYYVGPLNNVTEKANAIAVDKSGNVYITGSSDGGTSSTDAVTVKYNSAGEQQWARRYEGEGFDNGRAIVVDDSGYVYVAGDAFNDYLLIKYNSAGDTLWTRVYNGTANQTDEIYALAVNANGEIYVTGRSGGTGGASYDIVTIKYSVNGDSIWGERFNGPGNFNDEAYALQLDDKGNIYVAGFSTGSGSSGDMYLIKYSEGGTTIVRHSNEVLPNDFALYQNFPNPFNPTTNIQFDLPVAGYVSLKVFDMLGREVAVLANEERSAGVHAVSFDGSRLSSGVYVYTLKAGNYTAVKKLVLMK